MNIIGDIAGQYDTLIALLKKMPDDEPVSLGDMGDRGPKSKEVFDFFRSNGRAIMANHEHLLLEYFKNNNDYRGGGYYERDLWPIYNGGLVTLEQIKDCHQEYVDWISSLPLYIMEDGLFLSHAPKNPTLSLEQVCDLGSNAKDPKCDRSLLWNRGSTRRMPGHIQFHGHNALRKVEVYEDSEGIFGYNLDTSRAKVLSGYSTITKEIYTQEFI